MTKTDTSREAVGRLCVRLCHPTAGFRPTVSDAREAAETMRALLTERDALQARAERAEAGLADIQRAISYPVSKDIIQSGYDLRTPDRELMEYVYEKAESTLAQLDAEPAGVSDAMPYPGDSQ